MDIKKFIQEEVAKYHKTALLKEEIEDGVNDDFFPNFNINAINTISLYHFFDDALYQLGVDKTDLRMEMAKKLQEAIDANYNCSLK